MRTNNRPELILNFAGITGHARRTLSHNIQVNLFKAGYFWSPADWDGKPRELEAYSLHICSQEWNPAHITYANGPIQTEHRCRIFNASTESEEFIEAAKLAIVEERVIDGAKVRITPTNVEIDFTGLSAEIGTKAKAIQDEVFGR